MEPPLGYRLMNWEGWFDGRPWTLAYETNDERLRFRSLMARHCRQRGLYLRWQPGEIGTGFFTVQVFGSMEERAEATGRLTEPWD
jgi:hypothetical protein